MADERIVVPLDRRSTFRLVLWGALDGFCAGILVAAAIVIAVGASADMTVVIRLVGPLCMLVGGAVARIRAPAMGVLADADGVELHGLVRTRRVPWAAVAALGWTSPGRRLAVRERSGKVRTSPSRLPRRAPAGLVRLAADHGVAVEMGRSLNSGPEPTIEVPSPGG